jgi:hypothetical protein
MSEQNKATVRRIVEDHWNKKNPALIGELFAMDCVLTRRMAPCRAKMGRGSFTMRMRLPSLTSVSVPTTYWLTATK